MDSDMNKIGFSKNIYADALSMIGRGVKLICKETLRLINKAVHCQPYIFMVGEAMLLIVAAFIYTGTTRAERDYANKQSVIMQGKVDSLEVVNSYYQHRINNLGR